MTRRKTGPKLLLTVLALLLLAGGAEANPRRGKKVKLARAKIEKPVQAEAPAPEPVAGKQAAAAAAPIPSRGPTRIDFDDRLIQGQTNAAGSVYLYDRKELPLEPMVAKRESFLRDLVASTLGR